jgi:hypothetical protein
MVDVIEKMMEQKSTRDHDEPNKLIKVVFMAIQSFADGILKKKAQGLQYVKI